ncbi:MAG: hypothetical protein NC180_13165 [Muribaculaceae bacterium]|nr:hypothetical protein [Acetatifactor muris]MCM1494152.1 hypothetical protein [Muribaculaceae bacterium]MCM1560965.1 hypothetical protein [Butyrivibrio sp.]
MAASEKCFPFDAEEVGGVYDRVYIAEDFARYFRAFISSGVFMAESTNLQVIANGDMTVTLKPGDMIIDGYRYENEQDIILQLDPADGVANRIDRISVTWSKKDRDMHCTVQKGRSSYEPTAPEARRTAEYKDYVLADVYVAAGAILIKQSDITDVRLNTKLCGLATAFCKIDTSTIFNQFTEWFKEIREQGDSGVEKLLREYDAWIANLEEKQLQQCRELLEKMRDILSESAAGKLQLEIDELKAGKLDKDRLGGWSVYDEMLTQAQYDKLPDDVKNTPKMIFVIEKE